MYKCVKSFKFKCFKTSRKEWEYSSLVCTWQKKSDVGAPLLLKVFMLWNMHTYTEI